MSADALALVRALPPEERRRLAALKRRRDRHRRQHPLRYVQLWDAPPGQTSQLRAAQLLNPGADKVAAVLIAGGNRTGKTEAGAILTACALYGRDDPDVRDFCARHGLDPSVFPGGTSKVACSALTGNLSKTVQRPKLAKYLRPGAKWYGRYGTQEASVRVDNGGTCVFKSADQGPGKFQADDWDWWWSDEEHPKDVWAEGVMRLIDRGGIALATMTPLHGKTWVWEQFVDQPLDGYRWTQLSIYDNPHLDQDAIARALQGKGEHELAARTRGEFVALEGRVYNFHRHLHVIPSFRPPDDWPRWVGWDFGTSNPTAVIGIALDPRDNVAHIYREHYEANQTTAWHAGRYKALFGDENVQMIIADPEAKGERLTLVQQHGIATMAAKKGKGSVRAGINEVAARLAPDAEGKPHLVVHDCCPAVIREFEGYVWDTSGRKGDLPDMPLKKNDHAMDALRYVVSYLARIGYGLGESVMLRAAK